MYDFVLVIDTVSKEKVQNTMVLYINNILLQLVMANNIDKHTGSEYIY